MLSSYYCSFYNHQYLYTLHHLSFQHLFTFTFSLSAKVETIFFKNRLFLRVNLPPPSTLTKYWLNSSLSTILPDLHHLFGLFPCWFWICTKSPTFKSGKSRVPPLKVFSSSANFTAKACSLISRVNLHSFLTSLSSSSSSSSSSSLLWASILL